MKKSLKIFLFCIWIIITCSLIYVDKPCLAKQKQKVKKEEKTMTEEEKWQQIQNEMGEVESTIQNFFRNELPDDLPLEEQIERTMELLHKLAREGTWFYPYPLIIEDSIEYDPVEQSISYLYTVDPGRSGEIDFGSWYHRDELDPSFAAEEVNTEKMDWTSRKGVWVVLGIVLLSIFFCGLGNSIVMSILISFG